MQNKKYYALTINNSDLVKSFKTIDLVYEFIKDFCDVNVIAVERNELNFNIHYHLLVSNLKSDKNVLFNSGYIWYKELETDLEITKYYHYILKDGRYKIYNFLPKELNITTNETWYEKALRLCNQYNSLAELFNDNPDMIKKITQVSKLFYFINNKI